MFYEHNSSKFKFIMLFFFANAVCKYFSTRIYIVNKNIIQNS